MGRNKFSSKKKLIAKSLTKNSIIIAFNFLLAQNERNIYPANVSKHNSNREKEIILLMIPNRKTQS